MMERAALWRTMARKWLESAEEVENPALKKCYTERALRYRMMASMHERSQRAQKSSMSRAPKLGG
jgi:hypothetical protein